MKPRLFSVLLLYLAAPAVAADKIEEVRPVDAETAKSCKSVDTFSGARIGMGADKTTNAARSAAAKKAAKRGANSMVVKDVQMQGSGAMVTIDAYVCQL